MKYIPLPDEFEEKSFTYKKLKREKDIAVYEQSKGGIVVSYELIVVRKHEGYEAWNRKFPPSEYYPSSKDWGVFGWTIIDKEEALERMQKLLRKK